MFETNDENDTDSIDWRISISTFGRRGTFPDSLSEIDLSLSFGNFGDEFRQS